MSVNLVTPTVGSRVSQISLFAICKFDENILFYDFMKIYGYIVQFAFIMLVIRFQV